MINEKILFINFGGLGDEILFLPSILSVKKEFPDSKVTLALENRSKGITALTDCIDNILTANIKAGGKLGGKFGGKLGGKFWGKYIELLKLLCKIRKEKFDVVVSSGSNKFISIFLFLTGIKKRYGYNTGKLSQTLLTEAVNLDKNRYAVQMYHELVKPLTNVVTELPEFDIEKKKIIPNSVLIHPGVSRLSVEKRMIKTVSPQIWAEVVEKLADSGKKVFLAGGPDDKECIDIITNTVPPNKYENLYGTTNNLKELAELISSAEKFLCSDSAPLHIAVGLGVKTYAIFGSTDDKKLIPQNDRVVAIKADCNCSLRPCLWERRQTTCESLECLNISSDKIAKTVLNG